jgi:hypothetical protein
MYTGRIVADSPSSYRNSGTTVTYPRFSDSDTCAPVANTYPTNRDSNAALSNACHTAPADSADIPHRPGRQRPIG